LSAAIGAIYGSRQSPQISNSASTQADPNSTQSEAPRAQLNLALLKKPAQAPSLEEQAKFEAAKRSADSEKFNQQDLSRYRSGVLVQHTLQNISEQVAISDAEKSQLSEALSDFYIDLSSRDPFPENSLALEEELIVQVLGDKKGNDYLQAKALSSERMRNEQISLATAAFSQQLNLSPEQLNNFKNLLPNVVAETQSSLKAISQKVREAMYKDLSSSEQSTEAQNGQSQVEELVRQLREKRRALLNQALKPVLTEAQLNHLMEAEATAGSQGLWGLRGY